MKKVLQFLSLLLVMSWFQDCDKDEEYVPPSAVTTKSETMLSGGVKLFGDFRNFTKNDIIGFDVYGSNYFQNFVIENPSNGENTITINSGLYVGRTYNYRAYILSGTEFFYGLEESFKSTGSVLPNFISLSPSEGDFREEVQLVVDQEIIINSLNDISIIFNDVKAYPSRVENNIIFLKVPYYSGNKEANIKVDYFGKIIQTSLKFDLLAPVINTVSPEEVNFGDEITITGSHFEDQNSQFLKVLVNDLEAIIVSRSSTELVAKIPNEVQKKNISIKVISNLQEVIKENIITMKSPKITDYATTAYINDNLVLKGENFNPDYGKNEVYFENKKALLINGDANNLTVKVPSGAFSNWNPSIKVKISDELVSSNYPFSILDAAIKIKEDVDLTIRGYQLINNQIYVYGSDIYQPNELVIYKYSPENNEFFDKKIVDLPSSISPRYVETATEYLYLYYNKEGPDFYIINLVSGAMQQLPDFPAAPRYMGQVASYGGAIYMGGGSTNSTYNNINYSDFYKFDITNNSWSQKPDLEYQKYKPIRYNVHANNNCFVLGEKTNTTLGVYKLDGNTYSDINVTIDHPYSDLSGYKYFFKDNLFYIIEDRVFIGENKMRIFNTVTNDISEILDILPNNYIIIGLFNYENFAYIHTIDSQYVRHLLKLDLNKL